MQRRAQTDSLALQPLDGGWRVSNRLAGQHDVLHPGGGDGAVEGQNPGRSCGATNAQKNSLMVKLNGRIEEVDTLLS